MELRDKNILVAGLGGKTGVSAVRLLCARGARVTAADSKPESALQDSLQQLAGLSFDLVSGGLDPALAEGRDTILLSPGVPRALPLVSRALELGCEVIGDVELAYRLLPNPMAGITGTDGKSTTTAMVGSILQAAGRGRIAGNIGLPVLDLVDQVPPDQVLALELSSFQLESIVRFKPVVGCVLNVSPDHLDRYPDMDAYLAAKLRLFQNMDQECCAVLPVDDKRYRQLEDAVPRGVRTVRFSLPDRDADVHLENEVLTVDGEGVMATVELGVAGRHNVRNALGAAALARALGCGVTDIRNGLATFRGLAHRFEPVAVIEGVSFINDSKATTISAVESAIASAELGACFLLGGRDKGLNFAPLAEQLSRKDLRVFPFGEARKKIVDELGLDSHGQPTLGEALSTAWEFARKHAAPQVILSPGCTSYDEFANFEERGDYFREQVLHLCGRESHG